MVPILCKLKALLENTVLTSKNKIIKNKTVFKMYLNPFEIGIKNISLRFFLKQSSVPVGGLILPGYLKGYQAQVAYN